MKRVIGHILFLLFLLFGGGQFVHANTLSKNICEIPTWDFVTKHHVKIKTLDPGTVLIEDADMDLDEEFHSSDNLNKTNFVVSNHSLIDNWYLTFSSQFIFKDYTKNNVTSATPCGHSNPIYLEIGVFRI
ncbi:hypothetical protein [Flavobacterium sp.]|uniref:hypothetical protein n=1 Tax=Flavobacterium sp. TaxID=239 RepID=UPI002CE02937|nr:hypothetical protein [Flavobacterium sp.]HSD06848.1 hypothetical protein [Flavobacterium sp.]